MQRSSLRKRLRDCDGESRRDTHGIIHPNVRAHRATYGLSQDALADVCGLHRTYIGSVERCERNVTLSTLELLSVALKVSVPDLLTKL
jgi:transcriptional regulator with XRE-family HTH domain